VAPKEIAVIRKVYLDFLREKLADKEYRWILSRGMQYALIQASRLAGRPFCGPILGTLITNYRCNYDCVMCDLKLRDRELRARGLMEFDTARMKGILDAFAALGISGVGFTGGEPLIRKDIFELLAYTKKLGMISHLNTNGSLVTDQVAEKIIATKVDSVNISLDGASAATHDAIRGVRGAFELATEAVRRIAHLRRKKGALPRLKTVTVLQESNSDEVRDIITLAVSLGVDCVEFIPRQPFRMDADRQPAGASELHKMDKVAAYLLEQHQGEVKIENSPGQIKGIGRWLREMASPLRCSAAYNSYTVDCFGEIYPCLPWANWRKAVGNMRETGLQEFWYSSRYNRLRQETSACRQCYLNCQVELNLLFDPFWSRAASQPAERG
jgi:MoaA/NifB/PqqE/SkfB family radical SAM enzyme